MIEAIVLAAGMSTRTTGYKMTLPLGDKSVLERTVDSLLAVCDRVIVVGGYNAGICCEALKDYPDIEIVINYQHHRGMFSSIKRGMQALEGDTFFVIPGDQPLVKKATLEKLLNTRGMIVNPSYHGKKGHPVLFRNDCRREILKMPDDGILRDFIHRHRAAVVDVDDEGILLDIDTDRDYMEIHKKYMRRSEYG